MDGIQEFRYRRSNTVIIKHESELCPTSSLSGPAESFQSGGVFVIGFGGWNRIVAETLTFDKIGIVVAKVPT